MARAPGDPTRLIARFKAALKVAKPNSIADAELMAEILGMTWRNLRTTYIDPDADFPIVERGSEGRPWQFNVRAVVKHMIKRAEERAETARRRVAERAALLNFTVPEEEEALPFSEIGRLAELTYRLTDEKRSASDWVRRDQYRMVVGGLLIKLRDSLQGAVGRIDPAGKLPPAAREALVEELNTITLACHRDAQAFLEEQRAPIQPPRNRRRAREARIG